MFNKNSICKKKQIEGEIQDSTEYSIFNDKI